MNPEPSYHLHLDYPVHPVSRFGWNGHAPHRELAALLETTAADSAARWERWTRLPGIARIPATAPDARPELPAWRNRWFPGLDALALYGMIAELRPRRYMEIGSGMSTKFARQSAADGGFGTTIVSVDPVPRAEIDAICDRLIREPAERLDPALYEELEAGDILFIDSSHRAFTNSDVTVLVLEALPRLKPGVLVHFHDIYLPYDYPPPFANRYYNEQYLLAALLLAGGKRYVPVFASYFFASTEAYRVAAAPFWASIGLGAAESAAGGSFWLRISGD